MLTAKMSEHQEKDTNFNYDDELFEKEEDKQVQNKKAYMERKISSTSNSPTEKKEAETVRKSVTGLRKVKTLIE